MSCVRIERARPHTAVFRVTQRMMWSGLESASLRAAIELESHSQLFVRMTTKNFDEASRARQEGRKPVFED